MTGITLAGKTQIEQAVRDILVGFATVEEQLASVNILDGTLAAGRYHLFVAPFPLRLVQVSLTQISGSTVTADNSNYWGVSVLRYRNGTQQGAVVTKTTQVSGEAWAPSKDWNFDNSAFSDTHAEFAKGDTCQVQFTATGTPPATPARIGATFRWERL